MYFLMSSDLIKTQFVEMPNLRLFNITPILPSFCHNSDQTLFVFNTSNYKICYDIYNGHEYILILSCIVK